MSIKVIHAVRLLIIPVSHDYWLMVPMPETKLSESNAHIGFVTPKRVFFYLRSVYLQEAMTTSRAKALYNHGIRNAMSLAAAPAEKIEKIIAKALPRRGRKRAPDQKQGLKV